MMRLDRFITLNLVQPCRRLLGSAQPPATVEPIATQSLNPRLSTLNSKSALPILMYHSITDDPEPGVSPYYQVNTSPAVFRQHMQFLSDHGYRTISLSDLVGSLNSSTPAQLLNASSTPQRKFGSSTVVLTFDDGFRNFYTEAFPIMQQHGFTATMFLPTAFIGDERRQFRPVGSSALRPPPSAIGPPAPDCLTWREVRELHQAGIQIGSHTVNHPKLVDLPWSAIKSEIANSKSEIEQQLGQKTTAFCYPYAFPQANHDFCGRFRETLKETGYTCCVTTEIGRVQSGAAPYRLKRLPANTMDDVALLGAKLNGSYDWLNLPQHTAKQLRRAFASSGG